MHGLDFGLGNSPVNARAYRVTVMNGFLAVPVRSTGHR